MRDQEGTQHLRPQKGVWKRGYRLPDRSQYSDFVAALIMGGPQGVNDPDYKYPNKRNADFIQCV